MFIKTDFKRKKYLMDWYINNNYILCTHQFTIRELILMKTYLEILAKLFQTTQFKSKINSGKNKHYILV